MAGRVVTMMPARFRAVHRSCHGREREHSIDAELHQARGAQVFAMHEIPVQFLT
jgi:hypothetical protein